MGQTDDLCCVIQGHSVQQRKHKSTSIACYCYSTNAHKQLDAIA